MTDQFDAATDQLWDVYKGVPIYFNEASNRYWAAIDGKVYQEVKRMRSRLRARIDTALNREPTIYEIRDEMNDGTIKVIVASSFNGLSMHTDVVSKPQGSRRPHLPNRSLLGQSGRTYTNQDLIYVHDEETAAEMAEIAAQSARLRQRWDELVKTLDGPFHHADFDEYCDRYWLARAYEERNKC